MAGMRPRVHIVLESCNGKGKGKARTRARARATASAGVLVRSVGPMSTCGLAPALLLAEPIAMHGGCGPAPHHALICALAASISSSEGPTAATFWAANWDVHLRSTHRKHNAILQRQTLWVPKSPR